jgi:two-component system response regulator MtrA
MRILVIDEDVEFSKGLRYSLQREGHPVFIALDSSSVATLVEQRKPDLIILDKNLLEIDGLRPFASHQEDLDMPLILLVAHAREEERGVGEPLEQHLRAFEPRHLRRAEVVLRRLRRLLQEKRSTALEVGQLAIDFEKKQVAFYDHQLALTPIQFNLLTSLAIDAGRVLGYQELLEVVWGYRGEDSEARELLKVHVNRIRKKLNAVAAGGEGYIQSVRGFGYRLSPPDEQE